MATVLEMADIYTAHKGVVIIMLGKRESTGISSLSHLQNLQFAMEERLIVSLTCLHSLQSPALDLMGVGCLMLCFGNNDVCI